MGIVYTDYRFSMCCCRMLLSRAYPYGKVSLFASSCVTE